MHIESIWQYPVKSMIGTVVADAQLAPHGMVHDRTWAIRDEERGGIRGAKKIGDLMQFAATHTADGQVLITLPDGATVHSADADVHARLSAALQHEVTLWPLQAPTDLEHYRRGAPDSTDPMTELRAVDTGDADGHPEFNWVGKQVRIGEVVLDIPSACPRCVMVTRAVTTAIPADRAVLRHIVRDLDQNVGVYATVVQPGVVRAGDTVEVL